MEQAFCDAYNAGDLDALTALLADHATTELVGAQVEPEVGPAAIRTGSLTHILSDEHLRATVIRVEEAPYVAFHHVDGTLDSLAALTSSGPRVSAIRYHTRWHDAAFVSGVAGE